MMRRLNKRDANIAVGLFVGLALLTGGPVLAGVTLVGIAIYAVTMWVMVRINPPL